ncbi:MAG: hypothetical protein WAK76_03315 [Trebonia sp.]
MNTHKSGIIGVALRYLCIYPSLGSAQLDAGFVEMPYDELPINPVLSFQLEQWTPLEQARGKGPTRQASD